MSGAGGGGGGGGHGHSHGPVVGAAAGAPSGAPADVTQHVSRKDLFALNNATDAAHVLQGDASLVCRSDADAQLILGLSFNQTVRLAGLSLGGPLGAEQPRVLKLYVNRPALGFEDVADVEAAQEFALTDADLAPGAQLKLKVARFAAVNSLHLFVEGPDGADHVAVSSLKCVCASRESRPRALSLRARESERAHARSRSCALTSQRLRFAGFSDISSRAAARTGRSLRRRRRSSAASAEKRSCTRFPPVGADSDEAARRAGREVAVRLRSRERARARAHARAVARSTHCMSHWKPSP